MIVKGKAYEANIVLNKIELARCFAPRKYEIKEAIAELRRDKELQLKNAAYKPNYEKIKNVYSVNAAKLLKLEAEKRYTDIIAVQPLPIIDIINNLYIGMLKQVILCDYKHIDSSPLAQILLYAHLLW